MSGRQDSFRRFGAAALLCIGFAIDAGAAPPERNYQQFCATCHGRDGRATMPGAPSLRDNNNLYSMAEMDLFNRLKTGWDKHPPFFGLIPERDMLELIRYIRTLR